MTAAPLLNPNVPARNSIDRFGYPVTIQAMWDDVANTLVIPCANDMTAMSTAVGAKLDAVNDNLTNVRSLLTLANGFQDGIEGLLGTNNSLMTTLNTYVDGIETLIANTNTAIGSNGTKLDTIHADLVALNAALGPPAGVQEGSNSVLLLSSQTIKASAGTAYAISTTNTVELRDNATTRIFCPAGFMRFPSPVVCTTSIKVYGVAAASFTVWFV